MFLKWARSRPDETQAGEGDLVDLPATDLVQAFFGAHRANQADESMGLRDVRRPAPAATQGRPSPVRTEQTPRTVSGSRMSELTLPNQLESSTALGQTVIQRRPPVQPPVMPVEQDLTSPSIIQRAHDSDEDDEVTDEDLAKLARRVYPLVKRLLAIERERRPIR